MMLLLGDDLMLFGRRGVQRNALAADFNRAVLLPNPDLLPCVLPGHRVATPLPRHIGVAGDFALLVVAIRIRLPSVDGLQARSVLRSSNQHLFVRCAMHPLIGDFRHPAA